MTNNQTNNAALLNEIFIKPSQEIKADRFNEQSANDDLKCNGRCGSGTCMPCASG